MKSAGTVAIAVEQQQRPTFEIRRNIYRPYERARGPVGVSPTRINGIPWVWLTSKGTKR